MGLNDVVSSERTHIGIFGLRNSGKSSIINAITGQDISVVSEVPGTTTDPVKKAMEILPLGPVLIIDTPGIDDEGLLGEMRVKKTKQILNRIDLALLVVDVSVGLRKDDNELISLFKDRNIPYIVIYNKIDLFNNYKSNEKENEIYVSAVTNENINQLKEKIATLAKSVDNKKVIVSDLIEKGDIVVLVIPIDSSAPKGRIILPQQMVLREVIENGGIAVCCQVSELSDTLNSLKKSPELVITDSQVFNEVAKVVPDNIELTSFSILMARYKGNLKNLVDGARKLDTLKNGDTVLISEGCTHHRQCQDIGTVKLPKWISEYTGKNINFEFSSGGDFPEEISKYSLIIHCGGCMLNEKEMKYRIRNSEDFRIPITNYGMTIAYIHRIMERSIKMFKL